MTTEVPTVGTFCRCGHTWSGHATETLTAPCRNCECEGFDYANVDQLRGGNYTERLWREWDGFQKDKVHAKETWMAVEGSIDAVEKALLDNMRFIAQDESLTIHDIEAFRRIWEAGRESARGPIYAESDFKGLVQKAAGEEL